jgi:hypothetical protein
MSTNNTCANCGKGEESCGDLKACTACKLVKYCNRDCQIAHRPQHKKACKKRATELYDAALFEEHAPPEECPICMLPLPLYDTHTGTTFFSCCGKDICNGCIYAMRETGSKNMKLCPFCKTPPAKSDEEEFERTKKLMKTGNAYAFYMLGGYYRNGTYGLPRDGAKANELYLKAGELGCAVAYYNLGNSYLEGKGVDINTKKATHYYELAAMNGDVMARNNLGCLEGQAGNHQRAFKHYIISASAGDKMSLDAVKYGYTEGLVKKKEYANTLREYQKSQDEMKSDARDKALTARNQRTGG